VEAKLRPSHSIWPLVAAGGGYPPSIMKRGTLAFRASTMHSEISNSENEVGGSYLGLYGRSDRLWEANNFNNILV